MGNINTINKKVSEILRDENNEVIYKSWLSFTEDAQFDGEDIIINVPNNFIKEAIDMRYSETLEDLYRNELDFSKLVVKAASESYMNSSSLQETAPSSFQIGFVPEYKSYICW